MANERAACIVIVIVVLCVVILISIFGGSDDAPTEDQSKINLCIQKSTDFDKEHLIGNYLDELRLNDDYTDIEVISQNVIQRAHKLILAAHSKYFDVMIFSKNRRNESDRLEISFIDQKTLSIILNFIYIGSLPKHLSENDKNIELGTNILKAAHELEVDSLKCEISKYLGKRININNAGNLLALAEETNAMYLMTISSTYLLDNLKEIRKTREFQTLIEHKKNILTTAIDYHGKLPENSICSIQCQPATIKSYSVIENLKLFYKTRRFADVDIYTGNDTTTGIPVNKAILIGQSKKFKEQFQASPKFIQIDIDDVDSFAVEEFLRYMYSGWTEQMKKMSLSLIYLAGSYEMLPLRDRCEDIIIEELNVNNVAKLVVIADRMKLKRLSDTVGDFILKKHKEIVKTKAWTELKENHPDILNRIFR